MGMLWRWEVRNLSLMRGINSETNLRSCAQANTLHQSHAAPQPEPPRSQPSASPRPRLQSQTRSSRSCFTCLHLSFAPDLTETKFQSQPDEVSSADCLSDLSFNSCVFISAADDSLSRESWPRLGIPISSWALGLRKHIVCLIGVALRWAMLHETEINWNDTLRIAEAYQWRKIQSQQTSSPSSSHD